jgi:hypothetical protein
MSVDISYIERVYDTLTKMDVELDPDPIEFGPSRLNNKTALVRKHLSDTEKLFMEVSQNLHKYKRDLLVAETEYALEQTQLMADDPYVRSGRSQQEREALAATKLVSIQTRINNCRLAVHDLDDVLKVIKAKRTDLKDIQGRLKDQLKLCQEQISLGQRWGYTPDRSVFSDTSEADILIKAEPRLREVTAPSQEEDLVEVLFAQKPKASFEETFKGSISPSDIDGFFEEKVKPKTALDKIDLSKVENLDLDDILKDFS